MTAVIRHPEWLTLQIDGQPFYGLIRMVPRTAADGRLWSYRGVGYDDLCGNEGMEGSGVTRMKR